MTNRVPQTKKQRQDEAREKARVQRELDRKRKQRTRWIVQASAIVAAVAVVAVVGLVIYNATRPVVLVAGPLNMLSDGIALTGDGTKVTAVPTKAIQPGAQPVATDQTAVDKVHIVTYIDYQCPFCNQFETTNGSQIQTWVTDGVATLEVHPIAILDNSSQGTRYSSRAANAAACVANFDPDNFLAVNSALFAAQPAEGTSGLANDKIISIISGAGSTGTDVADCINKETFKSWVTDATKRALAGPLPNATDGTAAVTGTPTVMVNGSKYSGSLTDANAFYTFVGQIATAAATGGSTGTPTPTPTP